MSREARQFASAQLPWDKIKQVNTVPYDPLQTMHEYINQPTGGIQHHVCILTH
jgi:hypothetical protein